MIKAVVFDLDDTLYPERDYVRSGFRAVDQWLASQAVAPGFFETSEGLFESGIRGTVFDRALLSLGIEPESALLAKMVSVYRTHNPDLRLFPDAVSILDHFSSRKRLGLITDGYLLPQRQKVAALGLAGRLDSIVYSDEFGRENWKPSSIPYLKVMDELKVEGTECLYVGDNPAKDFVAANKLGWQTIRIIRHGGEYCQKQATPNGEPHFTVNSLEDLKQLIP